MVGIEGLEGEGMMPENKEINILCGVISFVVVFVLFLSTHLNSIDPDYPCPEGQKRHKFTLTGGGAFYPSYRKGWVCK